MLQEFLASGTLNIVYAAAVFTSFIFAVIILLGAEFGDAVGLGGEADADTGVDFISVSPFALAMFGASFGITGLVTRLWLEMSAIPSIAISAVAGFVVGAAAQVFFIYVLSPSKSSHYSLQQDAVHRQAEVITTIPANGLGEIAFDNISGRVKLGARSATGKQIRRGTLVRIERITGRVAIVTPVEEEQAS